MPCVPSVSFWTLAALSSAAVEAVSNVAASSSKSAFLGAADTASFVQGLKFNQVLRICNAYPYGTGMDVHLGSTKLTSFPLAYKTCDDYAPEIKPGDRVDFKVGSDSAGTFTISDLPAGDATLLLIIYRHDAVSTAAAFESHAFPKSEATQVAIIDTYKGKAHSEMRIQDVRPVTASKSPRSELLRYDSVVAINPGYYNVQLVGDDANSTVASKAEFVAAPKNNYLVVRCGVESVDGKAYPQELMIFPHSDKAALGAATHLRAPLSVVAALMAFSVGALPFQ